MGSHPWKLTWAVPPRPRSESNITNYKIFYRNYIIIIFQHLHLIFMSTYTQILYHFVFSTKNRQPWITPDEKRRLFMYMHQTLTNKKCHLYRINGVEDHIHILTHLHPSQAVSSLIKDLKLSSNQFITEERLFPKFNGWQEGYGGFTESIKDKQKLINYIKNQEEHHKKFSFLEEYKTILNEYEIEFDPKYLI
nr:IS200/IS605 family transposase [Anditalea andensis]